MKRLNVLGADIHCITLEEAILNAKEYFDGDICRMVATPNSEIIMNAMKDPEFMDILNSADMIIPDGIGLVYASKILKQPLKERVTGIDFAEGILEYLNNEGKSVFLFGSKPGIAEKAVENLSQKYPDIKFTGTYHGYYKDTEEEKIVELINEATADLLCVALGSPKQERFINKYRGRLKVKVAIGVGGSLDVWAGTLKRAPVFFQKTGLEWFYRLIQEPSRYKRMRILPLFMFKVLLKRKEAK